MNSAVYKPSRLKEEILTSLKSAFYQPGNHYATQIIVVEGTIARAPSIYGATAYFYLEDDQKVQVNVRAPKNMVQDLQKGLFVQIAGTVNLNSKANNIDYDILFCATDLLTKRVSQNAQKLTSLTQELYDQGYFSNKKPFPEFKEQSRCRVAIITSGNASANAMADIEGVLKDLPFYERVLVPVNLGSSEDIARGIRESDEKGFDILVLTRGGGEQLSIFDERPILDALHKSKTFTISAIGHAKDQSLSDMVSDFAARTPTDAARLLVEKYTSSLTYQQYSQLKKSNEELNKSLGDLFKHLEGYQEQIKRTESRLRKTQVLLAATVIVIFALLYFFIL